MRHHPKQYAKALYEITAREKGESLRYAIRGFLENLFRLGDLGLIRDIAASFEEYRREKEGRMSAVVSYAGRIEKGGLKNALGAKTDATFLENPKLMGGVMIETGEIRIDGTLRRRVADIKKVFR